MKGGVRLVGGGLLAAWVQVGAWTVSGVVHPRVWLFRLPVVSVDATSATSVATFGPLTLNTRKVYG